MFDRRAWMNEKRKRFPELQEAFELLGYQRQRWELKNMVTITLSSRITLRASRDALSHK